MTTLKLGTQQYIEGRDQAVTITQEVIDTELAVKETMRVYYLSCREQKTVTEVLEVSESGCTVRCSPELFERATQIAKRKGLSTPQLRK